MSPFEPVGSRARWRIIYEQLERLAVGEVLTYDAMGRALGLHPLEERHTIQMSMRRAAREFEEERKHAVKPVTNVGYQIVPVPEHLMLARGQQRKAGKALVRARSKVDNVDLNDVPDLTMRAVFQATRQALALQLDMMRRLDVRQTNLEEAVTSVVDRQERSEEELAELRERLARLEARAVGEPLPPS